LRKPASRNAVIIGPDSKNIVRVAKITNPNATGIEIRTLSQ